MSDIVLTRGVRSNLLSLQNTATLVERTQNRLATGKRVNNALDNPTNFFNASTLNARAGDLSSLFDSVSNAMKTLEAADNGIKAITKLMETAQATARQALNDRSEATRAASIYGTAAFAASRTEAETKTLVADAGITAGTVLTFSATNENGTAFTTNYTVQAGNTVRDLVEHVNRELGSSARAEITADGKFKIVSNAGGNLTITASAAGQLDNLLGEDNADASATTHVARVSATVASTGLTGQGGTAISAASLLVGTTNNGDLGFSAGDRLRLDVLNADGSIGQFYEMTFSATDDLADLESNIETALGTDVQVSVASGALTFTSQNGKAIRFTLTEATPGTGVGNNLSRLISGATGDVYTSSPTATNNRRTDLANQFNSLLSQIDGLAKDASFNGINLLWGDRLEVVFNERTGTLQSQLEILGVYFDAEGIGVTRVSGNFQNDAEIRGTLDQITDGLSRLRTQAGVFGSNLTVVQVRQNFTKEMINTLKTGSDALVLADMNEESASMLALQTRQQLSSTALSLASQADQSILRLFG